MIVVGLAGGLGNQLFQFAAARSLAAKRNTSVLVDGSWYRRNASLADLPGFNARRMELYDLDIPDLRVRHWIADGRSRVARKMAQAIPWTAPILGVFVERSLRFDRKVLSLPDGIYLSGYFQSEKYFAEQRDLLISELRPRSEAVRGAICLALRKACKDSHNIVSVHIRRGDYAAPDQKGHYEVGLERLTVAMEKFPNARFVIFSDDPEWCRQTLPCRPEIMLSPFLTPLEDMWAMSCCDHHILSGSTFAWWGAWLNQSPTKIVLAPSWPSRAHPGWGPESDDYYPAEWQRY